MSEEVKIRNLKNKLANYEKSLEYLTKWCENNQKTSDNITNWINSNTNNFNLNQLKTITSYHIEISKVHYATIALLDKVYKQKERLERWQSELEKV